jgi:segregation and condensation protein B
MTLSDSDHLKLIIESILFVADEPVEIASLARVTGRREAEVSDAVEAIAADGRNRGLRIQRTGDAVQMVTAPEATPFVEQFLGVDQDQRISHAALETLAIIAYKQPISRGLIEAIRGVNCDRALASIKARGLITEVGRASTAGRPYLYGTTFRFLEHFGLEKPEDLPPLPDMPQVPGVRSEESGLPEEEEGGESEDD